MIEINHEYYVSLEIAELLKQTGFNWYNCSYRYNDALKLSRNIPGRTYGGDYHCIAPTLDVAQRWLRAVKKYHIYVRPYDLDAGTYVVNIVVTDSIWGALQDDNKKAIIFKTYEEAQEAGIKKALELILEKVE